MKKNSNQADMQKPEVGEFYRTNRGIIIRVMSTVSSDVVFCRSADEKYSFYWHWPELSYDKLTPLEIELL